MNIIEDGTGNGYKLKIGSDNRLQGRVVRETEIVHATESGKAYNWNTGLISVSGDASFIYLKNNQDDQLVITDIALGAFDGITHSDAPYITVIRNPTGGDIISDATAVGMNANRNFGSTDTATVDVYKGKTGGTITGGSDLGILQLSKAGRSFFSIDLILNKGNSVAIKYTANRTNGSANYYCALIGYFKDTEDKG